jgi:hypothetical protein
MRSITVVVLLLVAGALAGAQVTVTGTSPANNATSVGTNTTISITFSAAIDTTLGFDNENNVLTNVTNVNGIAWSSDRRTVNVNAVLSPSTVYFVLVMSVTPAGGGYLQTPYVFYFTTAAAFPSNLYTVSGSISPGTTGISAANALVILDSAPFSGGNPMPSTGAVCDGAGNFSIPYVPAGKWYPIAAKDADRNGGIDPTKGDPIAYGDSVTVISSNVSGVTLVFKTFVAPRYMDVRDPILSYASGHLPSNKELRGVFGWGLDSLARCDDWQFLYTVAGSSTKMMIRGDMFGVYEDQLQGWMTPYDMRPITNLLSAALPDSVIARAERLGGSTFRKTKPADPLAELQVYIRGGDLRNTEFDWLITDTSKNYWGASYQWVKRITQDSSSFMFAKHFLADFTTGQILQVTGVEEQQAPVLPGRFALEQNYPNPFNPTTVLSYQLPTAGHVTLAVYDLLGRQVAMLVNGEIAAGAHRAEFNAAGLPSGIYIARMQAAGYSESRKMVLMR